MIKNDKSENNDKEKEAECLDNNSPDKMEEGLSDKKMTRMKNLQERKAECLDDTFPEETEEDVSDKKMTRVKIMMGKKRLNA